MPSMGSRSRSFDFQRELLVADVCMVLTSCPVNDLFPRVRMPALLSTGSQARIYTTSGAAARTEKMVASSFPQICA
jgi:hypothetical protein